jgi:hypothetical protein
VSGLTSAPPAKWHQLGLAGVDKRHAEYRQQIRQDSSCPEEQMAAGVDDA